MSFSTSLKFVSLRHEEFTVVFGDKLSISENSVLDFSHVWSAVVRSEERWTYLDLGSVLYGRLFKIQGGNINIKGAIKINPEADEVTKRNS